MQILFTQNNQTDWYSNNRKLLWTYVCHIEQPMWNPYIKYLRNNKAYTDFSTWVKSPAICQHSLLLSWIFIWAMRFFINLMLSWCENPHTELSENKVKRSYVIKIIKISSHNWDIKIWSCVWKVSKCTCVLVGVF